MASVWASTLRDNMPKYVKYILESNHDKMDSNVLFNLIHSYKLNVFRYILVYDMSYRT